MMSSLSDSAVVAGPAHTDQSKRSSMAGFFGSALEYYDMYIYASASALVFSQMFFREAGAHGLLLSLATYGWPTTPVPWAAS